MQEWRAICPREGPRAPQLATSVVVEAVAPGRSLVARRLGADALFVRQQVQSMEALIQKGGGSPMSARERAANEAFQARPEVRAMMREMTERHWAAWLDQNVPALGNVTPREAAKTRAGRERLEALLAFRVAGEGHAARPAPGPGQGARLGGTGPAVQLTLTGAPPPPYPIKREGR